MTRFPVRKKNRLENYDYSMPGFYFITFCTDKRECILGTIEDNSLSGDAIVCLSRLGEITKKAIERIQKCYSGVLVDRFVIMPNHVHMILVLKNTCKGLPSVSRVVQQTKGVVSKSAGRTIWQIHFHEHVIRGEQDYREIWEYIENNPQKWALDRYYSET